MVAGVARILVVDDLPENVRLLEAVLVPRGYDMTGAPDGEVEEHVEAEPAGEYTLEGFSRPVAAFNVLSLR